MIVIAATQNKHKIKEIDSITSRYGFKIISRKDAGIPDFEIEEDGDTFEENSYKKAMTIYKACGQITIADDSGLMVDCLKGLPGVYSSRFAGEDGNDQKNNKKLLKLMENITDKKRGAKFVSVITMVFSQNDVIVARGECAGRILNSARGERGFGYDPLFAPEGYDLSFSQMTAEQKNLISHRAKALEELENMLRKHNKYPNGVGV